MSIPSTFEHAQDSLAQLQDLTELGITQDFLDALGNEKTEVTAEIGLLEEQLKELKRSLDGLWEGRREVEYELVAVYMHRGERDGHSIQQQCLCTILELVPVFYGLQALGDEKCSC
jgi:ubiquitin carboxyl-terminal hydrolase 25/28